MPAFLIPLALGAASAIPKVAAAISQKNQANRLKLTSTVPGAFKEQLASLRMQAGTARLPGMGAAENKLGQTFAAGANAAVRAGGSSADALASISALSAQRQQGQNQLGIQGLQYRDTTTARLNAGLGQLAAYQKADQETFDRNKANLIQASNQNLMSAVDGATSAAATAYNMGAGINSGDASTLAQEGDTFASMAPRPTSYAGGLDALQALPGYLPTRPQNALGLNGYLTSRPRRRTF